MESDVQKLINSALKEVNEGNRQECERKVKEMVKTILGKQAHIKHLTQEIVDLKKALSEIQLPSELSIEF